MRRLVCLAMLLGPLTLFSAGCGGGAAEEGMPEDVDMSKDYTPPVEMPGMSPNMAKQAKKAAPK